MSEDQRAYTVKEFILYKLDRNIALVGIIGLGFGSMFLDIPETSRNILDKIIVALAAYVGARVVK